MREFIMQYWLEFLFGVLIAVLSAGVKTVKNRLKQQAQEQEALKHGLIAILHDRLFQSGMYFIGKGEIGLSELKNIEKLYEAYHALGGNGTGTEVYERVMDLKIIK